jgi:hypothetical protein
MLLETRPSSQTDGGWGCRGDDFLSHNLDTPHFFAAFQDICMAFYARLVCLDIIKWAFSSNT